MFIFSFYTMTTKSAQWRSEELHKLIKGLKDSAIEKMKMNKV